MTVLGRRLRLPALAALILVLPTPALAQYGHPITEREKEGLWRLGPFRLTPLVQLRNAGVDSNPFLAPTGGSEETEVVLRGGLKAHIPVGRRFRHRGDGWLDYTFFSNALEPRKTYPSGDLRAELDISRLTFFAGGGHFTARQRYSTDIDSRIERTEDWVSGGVQYQLTTIFGLDFAPEDRRFRYLAEAPEDERIKLLLDRDSLSCRAASATTPPRSPPSSSPPRSSRTPSATATPPGPPRTPTATWAASSSGRRRSSPASSSRACGTSRPAAPAPSSPTPAPPSAALSSCPSSSSVSASAPTSAATWNSSASVALTEEAPLRNTYVYDLWQPSLGFDLPLRFIGRLSAGWQNADYQVPVVVDGVETQREDRIRPSRAASCGAWAATPASA